MYKRGFFTGRLFWLYWFPLIIYCLAIFIQSAYPTPQQLPKFPYIDKVMHFIAYGIMGGLFFRALRVTRSSWRPVRVIFFSALLTTLYGMSDEIHQFFVVSRTSDQMDLLADFLGGTSGAICFYIVTRTFRRWCRQPSD